MKKIVKKLLHISGYEIKKLNKALPQSNFQVNNIGIGSHKRPIGSMNKLLEDLQFRGLKCSSIVDVGANKGNWSRMAQKIYQKANFCLIEPQLEMKEALEKFCQDFHGSTYISAGAGAKKEILTLTVWDDLAGSSLLPHPNEDLKNKGKQREIEITTIDELLKTSKIKMPELIKLDIQGFELEALRGASLTFGKTEVYIMEVSLIPFTDNPGIPLISDVINFMLERGYVVYDFPGFARRPLDGALGQCDICFVKQNGFLRTSNEWS